MLFSIITPCYNSEAWIRRCVASVVAGNDGIEYEHIIIDDGSTDQTLSICLSLASKDPRIKVIHRENRGYCTTMNELISLCKGDYIVSVDSDNWLSRGALSILSEEIQKTKADYYQFPICHVNLEGDVIRQTISSPAKQFSSRPSIESAILNKFLDLQTHGGKLISRSLFVPGIAFSGNPSGADGRLMEKIAYISNRIVSLERPSLYFEIRAESLSHLTKPPLFWAHYVSEELEGVWFYKKHHKEQTLPVAELISTFDIYMGSLLNVIYDKKLNRRNGRDIWKNRALLFKGGVQKKTKFFLACNFPSIARIGLRILAHHRKQPSPV